MELLLPETGKPEGRLVLEAGQLAGRAYRVQPKICENPICACWKISLHCLPEVSPDSADSQTPLIVELDLHERALDRPGLAEGSPVAALAKGVMDEITSEQWIDLSKYFHCLKIRFTESANLEELDTDFPPNASEGGMVGYYKILPFARPITFTAGGHDWAFDDQYCLRPDCSCKAAVLQSFCIKPQTANPGPSGPNISLRYDYATGRFQDLERDGESLSAEEFLTAIRQAQPDFDSFLASRHTQLRRLYRLFLKRHPHPRRRSDFIDADAPPKTIPDLRPHPVRAAQKPGRNESCPCGSGKKYKKCCGRN